MDLTEDSAVETPDQLVKIAMSVYYSAALSVLQQRNRMNPLNRVHSSADVQAVMVHFIIIGSVTSGERDIKNGVEETDRSGRWGGLDRRGQAGETKD